MGVHLALVGFCFRAINNFNGAHHQFFHPGLLQKLRNESRQLVEYFTNLLQRFSPASAFNEPEVEILQPKQSRGDNGIDVRISTLQRLFQFIPSAQADQRSMDGNHRLARVQILPS